MTKNLLEDLSRSHPIKKSVNHNSQDENQKILDHIFVLLKQAVTYQIRAFKVENAVSVVQQVRANYLRVNEITA